MTRHFVNIVIGEIGVRFSTTDQKCAVMLRERYRGFVNNARACHCNFEIETISPRVLKAERDLSVHCSGDNWVLERGDFYAIWFPSIKTGRVHQTRNPYSTDSVLRILHSLMLASEGGFLLHASSAVLNQKGFLFSGVSGAGKTTIAKLAPVDALLLTDEISYLRNTADGYWAYGTPFTGELGRNGENISAPIAAVFLLTKGPHNELRDVSKADAIRRLRRNVLFVTKDSTLVEAVFETVADFVNRVPVNELMFAPEPSVWKLIV